MIIFSNFLFKLIKNKIYFNRREIYFERSTIMKNLTNL
jgi:hypothetical protein